MYAIGSRFSLQDGTVVSPDILIASATRSFAILCELKSGAGTDFDQLSRMLRVTSGDLCERAYLPRPAVGEYRTAILHCCSAEHFDQRVADIRERKCSVIGYDGIQFRLGGAALPDTELSPGFLTARTTGPPWPFVPFDRESPPADVAIAISPFLGAALVKGSGTISHEAIARESHRLIFDAMASTGSGSERAELVRRIGDVLAEGSKQELREWLERVPGQPVYRFAKALSIEQAARTRDLKALQKALGDLARRLGASQGIQLELFDEADS